MVDPATLPDPFSSPLQYVYQNWSQKWAIITGAPMSVGALVFLACLGTWIVFHFLHKRQLDRIPILEERIKVKDEKIAELEQQLRSSTVPTPLDIKTGLFQGHDQLIIHSAMYGLGPGSDIDVLEQVRGIIERGERHIRVHPDTFGITDPYEGKTKRLLLTFSCGNSEKKTVTATDYGYINLPS